MVGRPVLVDSVSDFLRPVAGAVNATGLTLAPAAGGLAGRVKVGEITKAVAKMWCAPQEIERRDQPSWKAKRKCCISSRDSPKYPLSGDHQKFHASVDGASTRPAEITAQF